MGPPGLDGIDGLDGSDGATITDLTQIPQRAHSALTGLTADDHPQYALLAGRAAGQSLIGGTVAAATLSLQGNSADANNGIINVLSKLEFGSTITTPGASVFNFINTAALLNITVAGGLIRGWLFGGTHTYTVNPNGTRLLQLFAGNLTLTNTGNRTMSPADIFFAGVVLSPADTTVTTGWGVRGLFYNPTLSDTLVTSGTAAVGDLFAVRAGVASIGRSYTITRYGGVLVQNPPALGAGSTIATIVGLDLDDLTRGTANLSVRSAGAAVQMRHAGPAVFGANAAPTGVSVGLELQSTTLALLHARMTTAQRTALTALAGMEVFDTDLGTPQKAPTATQWKAVTLAKQTEVDFGTTPVEDATFTVADDQVKTTSHIDCWLSGDAPTGKDADEIGLDALLIAATPASAGNISIYVRGLEGYVHDKFKLDYVVH